MNILYVSSKKGWGGVASWMYRTALGLKQRGHRVWILSHPESRFTRSVPGGIDIIPKKLGMDFNPVMILSLGAFIKRNRVDIVVTNIQKEITVGGTAAKICGIASIRRIGNEKDINDRFRWRQTHLVDHTIVPSQTTLEHAVRRVEWIEPDRYTVIYNGRNPVTYSGEDLRLERAHWGIGPDELVIGCNAQLSDVKGLDRLIKVFGTVLERHPDCRLVLTGEGPEEENLKELARRLGISERVIFAGFSDEPMRAAAAYDVGVLNSSVEGLPNTIIEYMAAGTAIVSTEVGGVAEVIKDGENGLLVEIGDDGGLLGALSRVLEDPELRRRLGANAVETVKTRCSEDIMLDRLEDLFLKYSKRPADVI